VTSISLVGRREWRNRAVRVLERLAPLLVLVLLLAVWELGGRQVRNHIISYPSAIGAAAFRVAIKENVLFPALLETLKGLGLGYACAVGIGVPVGIVMGRSHIADVILDPYVTVLYATPRIALVPVLILWTGIGFSLRVTVTALMAVFPIIINTYQGVRSASPNHLEVAASFNAKRLQIVRTVVVPNALPYILAGLRLGAARALIGITVAEMVVGATGTGGLLMAWGRRLKVDQLFVPIIELGLLSIGLQKILMLVERAATPWRRAQVR
jgi:ABC-type nitrate/sulfonate/bicarbonate transport system permease component